MKFQWLVSFFSHSRKVSSIGCELPDAMIVSIHHKQIVTRVNCQSFRTLKASCVATLENESLFWPTGLKIDTKLNSCPSLWLSLDHLHSSPLHKVVEICPRILLECTVFWIHAERMGYHECVDYPPLFVKCVSFFCRLIANFILIGMRLLECHVCTSYIKTVPRVIFNIVRVQDPSRSLWSVLLLQVKRIWYTKPSPECDKHNILNKLEVCRVWQCVCMLILLCYWGCGQGFH